MDHNSSSPKENGNYDMESTEVTIEAKSVLGMNELSNSFLKQASGLSKWHGRGKRGGHE